MRRKLSPKQLELYNYIDKLLYEDWNPIGVDGLPEDEYESYIPTILSLVINGSVVEEIANKLLSIEKEQMGLAGNKKHCINIAEKIINKKNELSF